VAQADLVVAVSSQLADRWRGMGATVVLIPNGVQTSAYLNVHGERPVNLPSPVAGVVGDLSERIDTALLEALVDDGFSLLLVGPVSPRWDPARFAALVERPNVRWVGRQPFEAVPSFLRCLDVGITPYRDTEFNRASFPLKTLEYLAAGLPAVSTDLPAVRWLDTDLIRVASNPKELVAAARAAAAEAHAPAAVAARREFAQRHSWEHRAADLARAIGLLDT
jgi:teichuronic acid biosynthesis glycosyltransferase TuaH